VRLSVGLVFWVPLLPRFSCPIFPDIQATSTARYLALPWRTWSRATSALAIGKVSIIGLIPCRAVNSSIRVVSAGDPGLPPAILFSAESRLRASGGFAGTGGFARTGPGGFTGTGPVNGFHGWPPIDLAPLSWPNIASSPLVPLTCQPMDSARSGRPPGARVQRTPATATEAPSVFGAQQSHEASRGRTWLPVSEPVILNSVFDFLEEKPQAGLVPAKPLYMRGNTQSSMHYECYGDSCRTNNARRKYPGLP
jgi:hypothetical protein